MDRNLVTSINWKSLSYVWEVKDFLELREMAENEFSESSSRIESNLFGSEEHGIYFILWLFPYGQKQHSSVGSIDLSLMCKKIQNANFKDFVIAKWSAYFMDEDDNQIVRTKLKDPLKKYSNGGDGRRFSYSPADTSIHKWVVHNSLKIKCDVHIALNVSHEVNPYVSKQYNIPLMLMDVSEYCKENDSKDVTIICSNFVYQASKFMLCARSEVLRKMLNGNFKEGKKNEIHLLDVSPKSAENMLDFIHTDNCQILEASKNKNNKNEKDAYDLLDLFAIADRYDIKTLYTSCLDVLVHRIDEKTFLDMMIFAEQVNCRRLADAANRFLLQTNGLLIWNKLHSDYRNNKCTFNDSVSILSSPSFSSALSPCSFCTVCSSSLSLLSLSSSCFSFLDSSSSFLSSATPFFPASFASSSSTLYSCFDSTSASSCASAKLLAATVRVGSDIPMLKIKKERENLKFIQRRNTSVNTVQTPASLSTFRLVSYNDDKINNALNFGHSNYRNVLNYNSNKFAHTFTTTAATNNNSISSLQFTLLKSNCTSSSLASLSSCFSSSFASTLTSCSSLTSIDRSTLSNEASNISNNLCILHQTCSALQDHANSSSSPSLVYSFCINKQPATQITSLHSPLPDLYPLCLNNLDIDYCSSITKNKTFETNFNNELRRGRRNTFCEHSQGIVRGSNEEEAYEGSTDSSFIFKEEIKSENDKSAFDMHQ